MNLITNRLHYVSAENAQEFAKELVAEWLVTYKFHNWNKHDSTKKKVTEKEKIKRAEKIAESLRDHHRWRTHARSIRIEELENLQLKITNYSKNKKLNEAITRYYTLLQMTFETSIYKIFETPSSQINRFKAQQGAPAVDSGGAVSIFNLKCNKCGHETKIQANLGEKSPLRPGHLPFPADNKFKCPSCGVEDDVIHVRRQLEMQQKKPIVT